MTENQIHEIEQDQKFLEVLKELDGILEKYKKGVDLSYGELVYLQENQDTIKEYYKDEPAIWELAGIPESEWNNRK